MSQFHYLYNTARWKNRRKEQLTREPLCKMCLEQGRVTPASIADHVQQHNGDEDSFFNGALQSLCKPHHDGAKQAQEKSGKVRGCDVNGAPYARADW